MYFAMLYILLLFFFTKAQNEGLINYNAKKFKTNIPSPSYVLNYSKVE